MAKVEQKQVVVNEIKEKLEKATSAVLVDARGLSVAEDTELRKQLREAGVDYKVYKNTMMNFAVEGTQFEGLKDYFEGPSAIAICYDDPTVAAGILSKYMKTAKTLEFKAGVIEGTCYDAKLQLQTSHQEKYFSQDYLVLSRDQWQVLQELSRLLQTRTKLQKLNCYLQKLWRISRLETNYI